MRFKNLFSIIGPAMVGPSSSHTAGAVRLGRMARQLLGQVPRSADIYLYESFKDTYQGHGTDLALAAGLLDYDTDDLRIRESLALAEQLGMTIKFHPASGSGPHPNSVRIELKAAGREVQLLGASIGGGNITVYRMNGFDVQCSGEFPTLIMVHADKPGVIAGITGMIGESDINIGYMEVDRKGRNEEVMTVIETDALIPDDLIKRLRLLPYMIDVIQIDLSTRR
jgi:L-serine dehydratase